MAGENINGSNGIQAQAYGHPESYAAVPGPAASAVNPPEPAGDGEDKGPSKEEIGWFFVEQYYKTLCNEPGKLYLYYNKRSQFVSGDEAEKVQVAVGQKAISERIKQLDISDCKVRVLNVDSQESLKNILVQVIGEMSNKAEPHRKFVQTFVLAEQPSGYYVLNDIFRYIVLDEDELENGTENAGPETSVQEAGAVPGAASEADVTSQAGAVELDRKLEDINEQPAAKVNGITVPTPVVHVEDATVATAGVPEAASTADVNAAEMKAANEQVSSEQPREPEPTPAESPPKPSTTASTAPEPAAEPPKPSAPKTWANLVAANRAAAPAPASNPPPVAAAGTGTIKSKPAPAPKDSAPTPSAAEDANAKSQQNGNAGWQTAGSASEKRQNRNSSQSISGQDTALGYVKNVTDKVDASVLKEKLNSLGKLIYFDVSRPKNCAFVEFETVASLQAAIASNPHIIGGENVLVEERRPRATPYNNGNGYANRGNMRGGRGGNENRGNNAGRGNFKDGARGTFSNRAGRGGTPAARGRTGQPQAA